MKVEPFDDEAIIRTLLNNIVEKVPDAGEWL